jgi:hypothetical protein
LVRPSTASACARGVPLCSLAMSGAAARIAGAGR